MSPEEETEAGETSIPRNHQEAWKGQTTQGLFKKADIKGKSLEEPRQAKWSIFKRGGGGFGSEEGEGRGRDVP